MAQRVVKVELLLAAQGYMQGVDAAARKTRELGSETEKLEQKREAFNTLGSAAVGFGAAVAVGVGMAVSKFAEFDQQMSYVQAATHETAANMDLLRDAAMDAGARTVFSATEAAAAVEELSKAGVATADILGGALDGALDAAAAGGMQVAATAELMASTLAQFGLEGKDATHVADLLAAGAGKAQGEMSDLGGALNQAGLVANQFGLSVDETVGVLSAFANAGMLGSDAGTSLRTMLLRLANPTKEVVGLMQETGIQAYNAAGEFVGLDNLAGQLQSSLGDMTQAQRDQTLAMIFGQDAIRGANILMNEGAAGIQEWTDAVNDQGYAAETAAIRLDNLKGDIEALGGAWDTALISMGEGANGPLRMFVQDLTGMVDQFNALPQGAQQTALGVAAVTSAVALAAGGFMLAVPKVAAFNAALATMGTGAQRAGRMVGILGKTAGVAAAMFALAKGSEMAARGLGLMGDGAKTANETMSLLLEKDFDKVFSGLSSAGGRVKDLESAMDSLLASDFDNAFNRWGSDTFAFTGLQSSVGEAREQFALLGDSLAEMVNRGDGERAAALFDDLRDKFEAKGYSVDQLNEVMPQYQDALKGVANESELAGSATGVAADGLSDMEAAAAEADAALEGVSRALQDVGGTATSMGDANDRALSAMNKLTDAAKTEGASLYDTNDASIAFRDSLRDVEQAGRDSAQAILDNGGTLDEAIASWQRSRDAVIEARVAKGEDRDEAIAWADQNMGSASEVQAAMADVAAAVNNIPKKPVIDLTANTKQAYDALMSVQAALRSVTGNRSLHVSTGQGGQGGLVADNATGNFYAKGVKVKGFASGDFLPGIYPATPGGIHRFAEAGFDEGYVTTDPKYRAHSIGVMGQLANRLGLGQTPTLSAMPVGGGVPQVQRSFSNTQHITTLPGMSPAQVGDIAAERFERALRGA
jgi:TP901 family phage tail tape measure protein